LLAEPGKVGVLAQALLEAVGRGRDNELYVLLADLLELEEQLDPLLQAVRVALARHHPGVLVCPWPPGLEAPGGKVDRVESGVSVEELLERVAGARYQGAYARLRRTFARLGVSVVCAATDEPVPLVLDRLDRLRAV